MKKVICYLLVIVLVFTAFYGCKNKPKNKEVIKVGVILPLTGRYADGAASLKAGVSIAIEELNAACGYEKYKYYEYDTRSDAKNAIAGYAQLKATQNIKVFVTTYSDNSLILKPMAIKDNNLLICVASHADITKDNHNLVFRSCYTSADEIDFIMSSLKDNSSNSNLLVYNSNTEAGVAYDFKLRNDYKDNILKIVTYDEDVNSVKNITAIPEVETCDNILLLGFTPIMGTIVKSLVEYGYEGDIYANPGFNEPSALAAAGSASTRVKYIDYDFPYESKEHAVRESKAEKEYKAHFSWLSYSAYLSLKVMDQCVETEGFDIELIGKKLSEVESYDIDGCTFKTNGQGGILPSLKLVSK